MKFKNEDGTINALPIVGIFTLLALSLYILLFGLEIKEKIEETASEIITTTTTTMQKTTLNLCNGCTMNFISPSIDVTINGELDVSQIVKLYKLSTSNISFTSGDLELFSVESKGNTYVIKTGIKTGSAKLTAKYQDQVVETTINVVNVDNAKVEFKYDYYFVKKGKSIIPELDTYPYALNLSNANYCLNKSNTIISCNERENKVTGQQTGTSTYSIQYGKQKASTTIYVVENKISVKVKEGDTFKEVRGTNPVGNSFDIIIEFDETKDKLDNKNLNITFDSNPLGANVTFIAPDRSKNTYLYHVELSEGTSGTSIMRVELSNGSFTLFEITK